MTNQQAEACTLLFDLVTSLEPRLKTLSPWYTSLIATIDKWAVSEGNQGVKRAKDCLHEGWKAILGEGTTPLSFTKSDSNGLPLLVVPLVDRVNSCQKDARLLSAAQSLVRVTDLWSGIPTDKTISKSLEIIQGSRLPSTAKVEIDRFAAFLPKFFAAYPDAPWTKAWNRRIPFNESDTVMWRESRGPNGPLTANAHKDVLTLDECYTRAGTTLLEAVTDLGRQISDLVSRPGSSYSYSTGFSEAVLASSVLGGINHAELPGKLSFKQEKSGKVRLIAQPDWVTQYTMRPVHKWLTALHTSFPSDCTKDQRQCLPLLQTWTRDGDSLFSFDQSSCTDLFPFEFQLKILSERFGTALSEAARTVMTDRDWKVVMPSGKVRKIRWSVGQPLGMYGSWALMACAHHLLVQYCTWASNGYRFSNRPFDRYLILGDDVVIASRQVAEHYLKVVKRLGMKVNLAKSHISGGRTGVTPVAEFAKLTVWNGEVLTPIRPNMVLAAVRDSRQVVPLFIDLAQHSCFSPRLKLFVRIVKKHFSKSWKFLGPLLTIPTELGGVGYRDAESLGHKVAHIDANQIHPMLYFIADRIRAGMLKESQVFDYYLNEVSCLEVDAIREHPMTKYQNWYDTTHPLAPIRDGRVPSTREIALELVERGPGCYERYLNSEDMVVPPYCADRRALKADYRTSWEKAYRKAYTFPRPPRVYPVLNEQFIDTDLPVDIQALAASQYAVIAEVMWGRRSTS